MKKPVLKEDLLNYQFLSQLTCSPYENKAVFVVSKANKRNNGYNKNLWVLDLDTLVYKALTKHNKAKGFLFDGRSVLLCQCNSQDKNSYHTGYESFNLETGETEYSFTIPYPVNNLHKIDDNLYLVNANVNTNRDDSMSARELEAEEDYVPINELPFWDNGVGYVSGFRDSLFIFDKRDNSLFSITDKLFNTSNLAVCGSTIYFSGQHYNDKKCDKNGLFAYDIDTKKTKTIVAQGKMRVGKLQIVQGSLFVSATYADKFQNIDKDDWYILQGGKLKKLLDNDYTIGCNVSTDCRYGFGKATGEYENKLLYLTTEGKHSIPNTLTKSGDFDRVFSFDGAVDGIAVRSDIIVFSAMEKGALQEIYVFSGALSKKVTSFNKKALFGRYVGQPKYIGFTNSDNVEIDGWIIEPINYDKTKQYPAILSMHGGPCVAWGELFVHEMQMYAGQEYFVIFCNPRGSDGKGAEFADLRGKYGHEDFRDFMEFTDHALAEYPQIDKKRLGVLGGSYGGYMTNWIVGNTNRFAAAISMRSFCNPISDFGNSCIGYSFDVEQFQATPWTDLEKLWNHAPLKYAPNATTPTLFIHSIEDYNCPLSQGFEMFSALKYHGVPCEMVLFKGENHELSRSGKPLHRLRRLTEVMLWLNKYLKP